MALKNGISFKVIENSQSKGLIGRFKYTEESDVLKDYNEIIRVMENEFTSEEDK
ncbi:MAG: hypothetical protein RBQ97_11420 [Acholeplasma sp.]|nr:hypothetical protein [Acholeplasma sp.]